MSQILVRWRRLAKKIGELMSILKNNLEGVAKFVSESRCIRFQFMREVIGNLEHERSLSKIVKTNKLLLGTTAV